MHSTPRTSEAAARPLGRWWQHPVALLAGSGLAAGAAWLLIGWQPHLPAGVLLAVLGVLLAAEDLANHRLPNRLLAVAGTGLAVLLPLAAVLQGDPGALARAAIGGLALGAGFLLLALLQPTGLGMGDVKLAAVLGLWLGWLSWSSLVVGVLAAFVLGGAVSILLLVLRRVRRDSHIAFGPCLLLGAAVATAVHELAPSASLLGLV